MNSTHAFDQVWMDYSALRPGYPDAVFDFVLQAAQLPAGAEALEIGVGTGQATVGFASRGLGILGLEPGPALAMEARRKLAHYPMVSVQECTFEQWPAAGRKFSLVFSAQAYHWIDPDIGLAKPREILEPRGCLALFWNRKLASDSPLRRALDSAYATRAPALAKPAEHVANDVIQRFEYSNSYECLAASQFPWRRDYSAEEYVRLLGTYSDHLRLPAGVRHEMLRIIENAIERHGGTMAVEYECQCFIYRPK